MKSVSRVLRLLLALPLALLSSCATSQGTRFESGEHPVRLATVRHTWLSEEQLQLDFEPLPQPLFPAVMREEEAQAVLAAFAQSFPETELLQVLSASSSSTGMPAPWEARLRAEFLKHYGASWLPLPGSLQHSPLFMALRLSPRYMGPGIRDAAQQMFRSPIFLASITLSVLVYFAAWALPEPLFSKAFAATLTARLAFLVGLVELRHVALACLQLYREAQSARTVKELEAVASFGAAKGLPNAPPGGLGALLGPPRYAMAGGRSVQSASTAQVIADGTILFAGAVLGTAGSAVNSPCADGSRKKEGYQWHHLATDKNDSSPLRGGPWTPRFQQLFNKAGVILDDPANRVYLAGHQGPHSEEYHVEVYQRLEAAMGRCQSSAQCKMRLIEELQRIRNEVCTPGALLHRLLTRS